MKKLLSLTLIFTLILSTTVLAQSGDPSATPQPAKQQVNNAQPGGDPAAMLQQIKEKIKPQMIEKTGLTEAQVDKVIEINFEIRMQAATVLRDLNEADRSAKIAELKATKEKKYSEIPLTAEQIQSVKTFYEDMGKNMPQKTGN